MARAIKTQESDVEATGQFPLLRLSPYEALQVFCELLRDEVNHRAAHDLDGLALRRYYRRLFLTDGSYSTGADVTLSPLGVYGYASRLAPALESLREAGSAVRLLDAGCGYGTESLLFALSGADVTGVELVPERAELACSRIDFYQNRVPIPLSIRFINADVIRYLEKAEAFDIIWTMEAISHIHPVETFLSLAHRNLSPGGLLIISDPNGLNPVALYQAYRIRGTLCCTLRMKAHDPSSGAPVYETVERVFSVSGLVRRLREVGFEVKRVAVSGFLVSSLVPSSLHRSGLVFTLLTSLQKILQALPILRLTGTVYTVVSQKGYGSVGV